MIKQFLTENIVGIVIMGGVILFQYSKILFERNKVEIDKIKALNSKLCEEKEAEKQNKKSSYKIDIAIIPHWLEILKYYNSTLDDDDFHRKICKKYIKEIQENGKLTAQTNQFYQNVNCPQFMYFNIFFDGMRQKTKIWNATLSQFSNDTMQNFFFKLDESDDFFWSETTTVYVDETSVIIEEMPISFIPTRHVLSEIIRHYDLNIPKNLFVLSFSKELEEALSRCGVKYSANQYETVSETNNPNHDSGYYPDGRPIDHSKFDLTREECCLKVSEGEFKEYSIEDFLKEDERDKVDSINWCKYNETKYQKTLNGMNLVNVSTHDFPKHIDKHILSNQFMTVEFSIVFEDENYASMNYDSDSDYYSIAGYGTEDPQSIIDAYKKS